MNKRVRRRQSRSAQRGVAIDRKLYVQYLATFRGGSRQNPCKVASRLDMIWPDSPVAATPPKKSGLVRLSVYIRESSSVMIVKPDR